MIVRVKPAMNGLISRMIMSSTMFENPKQIRTKSLCPLLTVQGSHCPPEDTRHSQRVVRRKY